MLQTFLPPLIVLIGVKVFEVWGAPPKALHFAESFDTICLSIMIVLISLNSLGQFLAVGADWWVIWAKKKSSDDSQTSS